MDKNLQQFPKEDIFNPWKPWAIGTFSLFMLALIGLWLMWEAVPSWYSLGLIASGASCAVTFFGSMLDEEWVKVPKIQSDNVGYWHVTPAGFSAAVSRNWSRQEQKELIYLFDGMPITILYVDKTGAEHQSRFIVRFKYNGGPLYARYLCFYKWYLAFPKTNNEAFKYVLKPTAPFFSIEPINAPATPALNA